MLLVDSSVWIDFLRGTITPQSDRLAEWLGTRPLAIGDLMMAEVLQGCDSEKDFQTTHRLLNAVDQIEIGGIAVSVQAARNFRTLRDRGITVRKTIDTLIATRCISDGHALLFSDRDFEPFVAHLGLRDAME